MHTIGLVYSVSWALLGEQVRIQIPADEGRGLHHAMRGHAMRGQAMRVEAYTMR